MMTKIFRVEYKMNGDDRLLFLPTKKLATEFKNSVNEWNNYKESIFIRLFTNHCKVSSFMASKRTIKKIIEEFNSKRNKGVGSFGSIKKTTLIKIF